LVGAFRLVLTWGLTGAFLRSAEPLKVTFGLALDVWLRLRGLTFTLVDFFVLALDVLGELLLEAAVFLAPARLICFGADTATRRDGRDPRLMEELVLARDGRDAVFDEPCDRVRLEIDSLILISSQRNFLIGHFAIRVKWLFYNRLDGECQISDGLS